jgi:hypothetical protein
MFHILLLKIKVYDARLFKCIEGLRNVSYPINNDDNNYRNIYLHLNVLENFILICRNIEIIVGIDFHFQ